MRRRLIRVTMLAFAATISLGTISEDSRAKDPTTFEKHIRPLLATKCLPCHGAQKQEANLRLDTRDGLLQGGDSGPAIVVDSPDESLLIEAIEYESFEMPPEGRLADASIERMKDWIAKGAVWPDHQQPLRPVAREIDDADRQWWAFRPFEKPDVPHPAEDHWSRNPIDRFVFQQMVRQEMRPAPCADEFTLVRRLYYDLLGLPPSPEQIDQYLNNTSPDRWEELIDRLLADPAYGEHWGRYWLDLVRYAESDGWNQDAYRPHIWRYRDYVVKSFNEDRPYPEFVLQQLAGDEMTSDNPDNLAATGFLRLGIYEYNQRDARSLWNDVVNEMTDVTADVFLGIGMACARCHDHKFDPLLKTDYYKLRSFLEPIIWRDDARYATAAQLAECETQMDAWREATQEVRAKIDALLQPYHDKKWKSTVEKFPLDIQACFHKPLDERTSWEHQMAYLVERQFQEEGGGPLAGMSKEHKEQHERLKQELAEFDEIKPQAAPPLMTVANFQGPVSPTLIPDSSHPSPITPGFPVVLTRDAASSKSSGDNQEDSRLRRTELAQWICRADNPLTTRLIVNRIWQHHFGRGLVATPNDFGHLGQPPSHPELLDWLAVTFVENGWSTKRLHKLILMSATWRQSAQHPQAADFGRADPADQWLWRAPVRRLNAEQIRDSMLCVSGELDRRRGGPGVDNHVPRRSLYIRRHRNKPVDLLHAFDAANGLKSVAERNRTTTPMQALLMINGAFSLERAKKLALYVQQSALSTSEETLAYAFRLTWGRPPTDVELTESLEFLGTAPEQAATSIDGEKLIDFCHVLLNSNEFLYID